MCPSRFGAEPSERGRSGKSIPSLYFLKIKKKKNTATKQVQCERDSAQNHFSHCHAQGFVFKDGAKGGLEGCKGM